MSKCLTTVEQRNYDIVGGLFNSTENEQFLHATIGINFMNITTFTERSQSKIHISCRSIYVTFEWANLIHSDRRQKGGSFWGAVTRKGEEGASGSWQCPISPSSGALMAVCGCVHFVKLYLALSYNLVTIL